MKSFKRSRRVADQIQRDVSEVILERMRDGSSIMITVSAVEVSDDLKFAKVFYTVLGDSPDKTEAAETFFKHSGKSIQSELARRLHIRRLPELSFQFDKSLVEGMRIAALIDKVMTKDNEQEN